MSARGVTRIGRYWAACPAALWDPSAQPKPHKDGRPRRLKLGHVTRLTEALSTEYLADEHCVAYVVLDPSGSVVPRPPRVDKEGLTELTQRGYRLVFGSRWADIDEPKAPGAAEHAALTDERWTQYQAILSQYDCAYYRTRGGARVVQTLSRLLGPAEYEVCIDRWLGELRALMAPVGSVVVDDQCSDWTRLMRLPKVVREHDDGSHTNWWHTRVYSDRLSAIDPGDCTPPRPTPKPWSPPRIQSAAHRQASGNSRYGAAALRNALARLSSLPAGARHKRIYSTAADIGSLVAGGELPDALDEMLAAISHYDDPLHERACRDGYARGLQSPRSASRQRLDLDALRARWQRPAPMPSADSGMAVDADGEVL